MPDVQPEPTLRVGVVGSRTFCNYPFLLRILDDLLWLWGDFTVISGGAWGADELGIRWAQDRGLPFIVYEAKWDDLSQPDAKIETRMDGTKFDVRAGFRRNQQIVDASDRIVAFWDSRSRGTLDTLTKAKKSKKGIYIFWPGKDPIVKASTD